jgi:2-hydroxy-3-keto-5-methylthiopentenyl-1-phosphate phosphatase
VLVDFDGTACRADVGNELCTRFADGDWRRYDDAVAAGDLSLRGAVDAQVEMLAANEEEMVDFVLSRHAVDPGFVALVDWAHGRGLKVAIVSDGFSFYIEPMLAAAGLPSTAVYRNQLVRGGAGSWSLDHPHGHPQCRGCGTCKMLVVRRYGRAGAVAYVGDGESDRFAAQYADVVFARERLAQICAGEEIVHRVWRHFGEVREGIEGLGEVWPRKGPAVCPGWAPRPHDAVRG